MTPTDRETILIDALAEIINFSANGDVIRIARNALIDAQANRLPCMYRFEDEFDERIRENALEWAIQEHGFEWFGGHEALQELFVRENELTLRTRMNHAVADERMEAAVDRHELKLSEAA